MLDIADVYMDIYLPTLDAGRVKIGNDARILLDAYPDHPIRAKVTFLAAQAQFTPKAVETKSERDKLMFRVKVRIDPDILSKYAESVRTGLPGNAYVRVDPNVEWPRVATRPVQPMTSGDPCVASVHEVSLSYGKKVALDRVSLSLPAGKRIALIGPDGVGKSSLLSLIAGSRRIQTGRVKVLGGDMREMRHRATVCSKIAYMPQGLGKNLYPDLSVAENIDFFARLFGQAKAERERRIDELTQSTGLNPFNDRPARKLSGGMRQKLGLCCALIHDPTLLILDEPTTGVDPLSRRQFWELTERIRMRRPGMSLLVATAYMEEAEHFDWLVAMDAGRIIATGTPQELKANTGASNLEDAFIALLPAARRRGRASLVIPKRPPSDEAPVIVARDLTCRFGDFTAVDNVNFSIERGEIFGFLGSNGCGKTTTMKMLTGLLPASSGEALLFGQAIEAGGMSARARVGYMSQSFSLYTELTVRQNLQLHARLFHLPSAQAKTRIDTVVEKFGLTDYLDQGALDLPLGIRQRLSLAVAIVHGPEMLILDEPTSGVDPMARDQFWELLIDLSRNQGVTIFISTHFMNEAMRCDRIALMDAGRVLAIGTPAALTKARNCENLEDAFISYLEEAIRSRRATGEAAPAIPGREHSSCGNHRGATQQHKCLGSVRAACSPIRSASRSNSCGIRSGWDLPSSARHS